MNGVRARRDPRRRLAGDRLRRGGGRERRREAARAAELRRDARGNRVLGQLRASSGIGFPCASYSDHSADEGFSLTHSTRLSFSPSRWLSSVRNCSISDYPYEYYRIHNERLRRGCHRVRSKLT